MQQYVALLLTLCHVPAIVARGVQEFTVIMGDGVMNRITQAIVLLVVVSAPAYAGGPVQVTPEPATLALVVTGLGAIGVGAWWKRRR